jgi:ketosteroid isomerase-like protein
LSIALLGVVTAHTSPESIDERQTIAALDTEYQLAVKNNDAVTMDRILADDFVLVLGNGNRSSRKPI